MEFYIYAETDGVVSLIDEAGEYNPAYAVKDPVVRQEANKSGSLEFTIHPMHPYFNQFIKMKTKMWVIQDEQCIFYGRVLYAHKDMPGCKKVYCEGALSYLLDSLVEKNRALRIQSYLGHLNPPVINVRDYTKFDLTVADFFKLLIFLHNSQVEAAKQFTIGTISFDGQSERYTFDIDGQTNSADFILDNLVDKVGGFVTIRPVFTNGALTAKYIDWKKIPDTNENTQTIEFGKNMVDFDSDESGVELFTVFVPNGKPVESGSKDFHLYDIENWDDPAVEAEHPHHFYFNHKTGEKYTTSRGGPDEVEVQIVADATTYTNEIQILTGIAEYGRITKAYDIENVTSGDKLYDLSVEKVIKLYDPEPEQVEVTAIDLHKLGYTDQSVIRFGAYLNVRSIPHGLDRRMMCCSIEHNLRAPENNRFTITSDLNEKGDGVPVFSKETTRSRGGGGGGGGGGVASLSEMTAEIDKWYDFGLKQLNEKEFGLFSTAKDFKVMANTLGFTTTEEGGSGQSSEINILKEAINLHTGGRPYKLDEDGNIVYENGQPVYLDLDNAADVNIVNDLFEVALGTGWNPEDRTFQQINSRFRVTDTTAELLVGDAEPWARNHQYHVGDYVYQNGNVYTCKTAHTSGSSFDSSKWNLVGTGTAGYIKIDQVVDGLNKRTDLTINADNIMIGSGQSQITLAGKTDVLGKLSVSNGQLVVDGATSLHGNVFVGGSLSVSDNEGYGHFSAGMSTFHGDIRYVAGESGSGAVSLLSGMSSIRVVQDSGGNTYHIEGKTLGNDSWTTIENTTFSRASAPSVVQGHWSGGTYTATDGNTSASTTIDDVDSYETDSEKIKINSGGLIEIPVKVLAYRDDDSEHPEQVATDKVSVSPSRFLKTDTFTTNGTKTPGEGYIGFSSVIVNVQDSAVTLSDPTWKSGSSSNSNQFTVSASNGKSKSEYVYLTQGSWSSGSKYVYITHGDTSESSRVARLQVAIPSINIPNQWSSYSVDPGADVKINVAGTYKYHKATITCGGASKTLRINILQG